MVHRLRQGWQEERTAGLNRLRGLLAEFGRVYPNSAAAALAGARAALADEALPAALRRGVARQLEHLRELDAAVSPSATTKSPVQARDDPRAQRVRALGRRRSAHRQRRRRDRRRPTAVSLRPPVRRLARASRRGSTRPAAKRAWAASPAAATPICGRCWCKARARRCRPPCALHPTRRTRLAAWIAHHLRAHRLSQDLGGDRQQARPPDLGAAHPRRAAARACRLELKTHSFRRLRGAMLRRRSDRRCAHLANLAAATRGR